MLCYKHAAGDGNLQALQAAQKATGPISLLWPEEPSVRKGSFQAQVALLVSKGTNWMSRYAEAI